MDLAVIRIKRLLEEDPSEHINLSSKKCKLELNSSVSLLTTLPVKDDGVHVILENVIAKVKKQYKKENSPQAAADHQELYKEKTRYRINVATERADAASRQRFQIISRARGMTEINDDLEKYLFDNKSPSHCNEHNNVSESLIRITDSGPSKESVSIIKRELGVQVLDVHISPECDDSKDDVICVNGIPMEKTYVYDIFVAKVPRDFSHEDLEIIRPDEVQYFSSVEHECQSADSEDSNAENNVRADYPDMDESDFECAEKEDQNYLDNIDTVGCYVNDADDLDRDFLKRLKKCKVFSSGSSLASSPEESDEEWKNIKQLNAPRFRRIRHDTKAVLQDMAKYGYDDTSSDDSELEDDDE